MLPLTESTHIHSLAFPFPPSYTGVAGAPAGKKAKPKRAARSPAEILASLFRVKTDGAYIGGGARYIEPVGVRLWSYCCEHGRWRHGKCQECKEYLQRFRTSSSLSRLAVQTAKVSKLPTQRSADIEINSISDQHQYASRQQITRGKVTFALSGQRGPQSTRRPDVPNRDDLAPRTVVVSRGCRICKLGVGRCRAAGGKGHLTSSEATVPVAPKRPRAIGSNEAIAPGSLTATGQHSTARFTEGGRHNVGPTGSNLGNAMGNGGGGAPMKRRHHRHQRCGRGICTHA